MAIILAEKLVMYRDSSVKSSSQKFLAQKLVKSCLHKIRGISYCSRIRTMVVDFGHARDFTILPRHNENRYKIDRINESRHPFVRPRCETNRNDHFRWLKIVFSHRRK